MSKTETLERNPSATARAPGPEYGRLNVFVGRWKMEGLQRDSPLGPAAEIDAVETYEWLPGGFFLIHRIDGTLGDRELACIEVTGYDASRRLYTLHTFYVDGTSNQWQARELDGTWTYTGTWQATGERMQVRCTQVFNEARNASTSKWEYSTDGSQWQVFWDLRAIKVE